MKKYVITKENEVIIGHVDFHRDLRTSRSEIMSGGYWYYDRAQNNIYFYGSSEEFGAATLEQLEESFCLALGGEFNAFFCTEQFDMEHNLTKIKEVSKPFKFKE